MTRLGVVLSAVLLMLGLMPTSLKAQASAAAPAPEPKKAEEVFKNIQVLKGVPANQIFPAMQFISASLGVRCEYCHVERQFDKDDKEHKKVARKMMTMMFAVNKDNFDGRPEVTCNSCHHGAAEPAGVPEIAAAMPGPQPAHEEHEMGGESHGGGMQAGGVMAAMPNAQQVLEKYVQAVGGEDAMNKVTSRVEKGSLSGFGPPSPVEIYAKAPDKRVSIVHTQRGDMFTAFDGQTGWMTGFDGHNHDMEGADVYAARLDGDFQLFTDAPKVFKQVRMGRPEKVGDKDAWVLLGITPGEPPVKLYFDKDSGLLLRQVRYAQTPVGRFPTQVDYADFREADGVKIPYQWTIARPGNSFTIKVDQVQQNVAVDDAKFAKPAEQKPAGE